MLLTINDDMYLSVQIVRVIWVRAEKADNLGGIMTMLGKNRIERRNLFIPRDVHLKSTVNKIPIDPQNALGKLTIYFSKVRCHVRLEFEL
jgi:hypothetical protein